MRLFLPFMMFIACLAFGAASVQAQITLTKSADMFFGNLGYDAAHSGTLQLGTDGTLSVVGGAGLAYGGGATPGSVTITGTPSDVVEIKCQTTGKMRLGNSTLNLQNPEIAIDTGVAFGSGNNCQDIKKNSTPATTVDLAANPSPVVLMGAEVPIPNNGLSSGTYTTNAGGGSAVTLRVIFQ